MAKGKFKRVIYFEGKKITLRDDNTTMLLNLAPMLFGILNGLILSIGIIYKVNMSYIFILQLIVIFIMVIYSYIHIINLYNINHFYSVCKNNEDKIKEISKINGLSFSLLKNSTEKMINDNIMYIKDKIKKIRPEDDLKSIMYLKTLLDINDYELLELLQEKFCFWGYGDEIVHELDMFNTSKLSKNEYYSSILNLFVTTDLEHYYDRDDLKDTCNNYLLLFYTQI